MKEFYWAGCSFSWYRLLCHSLVRLEICGAFFITWKVNRLITALYSRMILMAILTLAISGLTVIIYFNSPSTTVRLIDPENHPIHLNTTGKLFFDGNCSGCHALHQTHSDFFVQGIKKLKEKELLYGFIKYPENAISRSENLQAMQQAYWRMKHPAFPNLSRSQIDSVLDYINTVELSKAQRWFSAQECDATNA